MTRHLTSCTTLGTALALALTVGSTATAQAPLALTTAKITIAGTSNVHDYTATTAKATLTNVKLGSAVAGDTFWDEVQKPGGLAGFEIVIPAESLKSSKEGLDKNMYKALKTKEHKDITADFFSLRKIFQGGRWIFTESSNPLNPKSHADIAWAGGLSSKAATLNPATVSATLI